MSSAIADLEILPLIEDDVLNLEGFTCGDADLDDFLRSDALRLQTEGVVRTYVARHRASGSLVVGYVSLLADAVHLQTRERRSMRLRREDHPIVPAVKIARLGVAFEAQRGNGIGTALVRFGYLAAAQMAGTIGCRLLTLDAYPRSVAFYERLGFVRNKAKEYRGRSHPSMRLDVFAPEPPSWLYA